MRPAPREGGCQRARRVEPCDGWTDERWPRSPTSNRCARLSYATDRRCPTRRAPCCAPPLRWRRTSAAITPWDTVIALAAAMTTAATAGNRPARTSHHSTDAEPRSAQRHTHSARYRHEQVRTVTSPASGQLRSSSDCRRRVWRVRRPVERRPTPGREGEPRRRRGWALLRRQDLRSGLLDPRPQPFSACFGLLVTDGRHFEQSPIAHRLSTLDKNQPSDLCFLRGEVQVA